MRLVFGIFTVFVFIISLSSETLASSTYQQVIQSFQAVVHQDRQYQNREKKASFYLRDNYGAVLLAHPENKAKGIVIMLHGFTAGPWQYNNALGQSLFKLGYTVYAPRLPGHGWMTDKIESTHLKMPRSNEINRYEDYIDDLYSQISHLDLPIHLVGLSGGANLALRIVEKYPQKIDRTLVMAPFLGADYPSQLIYGFTNSMNFLTLSSFGLLLDGFVRDFPGTDVKPNDPHPHTSNTLGNALPIYNIATQIKKLPKAVQFMTTEGDPLAGKQPVGHLYFKTGGPDLHHWYHFRAEEKVPHPMTNDFEYKHPEKRKEIFEIIIAHIAHGIIFHRPPNNYVQYDLSRVRQEKI